MTEILKKTLYFHFYLGSAMHITKYSLSKVPQYKAMDRSSKYLSIILGNELKWSQKYYIAILE